LAISEQDINVGLPRALVGGVKRDAVEDLLRQIARDYRRLEQENARLWETLEGFEPRPKEPVQGAESVTAPEDISVIMLSLAQRAARELRESTREECELMLKKARAQADRIERELDRSAAELEEIQVLRSELCDQLRSTLEALLADIRGRERERSDSVRGYLEAGRLHRSRLP
jgi:cell division septum initiation protein DivIVA